MNISNQEYVAGSKIDRRAYSIAINAVREMRMAYGRDDSIWTDDDARRVNAIYGLLHLASSEEIEMSKEGYPLVAVQQVGENAILDDLERKIALLNKYYTYNPKIGDQKEYGKDMPPVAVGA